MSERNKEIVREYYSRVINGRDLDAVGEFFADDRMVEGVKAGCFRYFEAFPDLHVALDDLIAELSLARGLFPRVREPGLGFQHRPFELVSEYQPTGDQPAAIDALSRGVEAGGTPFRLPGGGVAPFLALAVIAFLLTSIPRNEWLVVLGVLAAASLVYALTRRRRPAPSA